jgi:hypothetical protein
VGDGVAVTGRDISDALRLEQSRHAAELEARDRASAVRTLSRIQRLPSAEETGRQITDALLELPGVDVAIVFGYVGASDVAILAISGPADYPLHAGQVLPRQRATYLRERAVGGPWAEPWQSRDEDEAYASQLNAAGLQALAFGPIGSPTDPVGLLAVGSIARSQSAGLTENLPAVAEFATTAAGLLGDELRQRRDRAAVRSRIQRLIAGREFDAVFQPIVDLANGRPLGYEALSRFSSGRRPDLVFAEAEEVGLGHDLEAATLRAAVRASRDLPTGPWVSLNVAGSFVVEDRRLAGILLERTRPIVLEITEHDPISDYGALRAAIEALGPDVRAAVDDAGVGVANFAQMSTCDRTS